MTNLNYAKEWLTKELIKTDFEEKNTGETKYIKIRRTDLYRLFIRFIKVIERNY